jgi:hypothetical protein
MSETWDEEALRILKRRARTHELLAFVTWLEDNNDEGNFGQIGQVAEAEDDGGNEGVEIELEDGSIFHADQDIRRILRSQIECMREKERVVHLSLLVIGGVLEAYGGTIPPAQRQWYRQFLVGFETFREVLYGATTGKTSAQLAQQVSESREACRKVLLDYFAVGEQAVDVSHEITFNNGNLGAAVGCLASWVNVNMEAAAMRREYEPVIEQLEKDLALALAVQHKTYWFSTYERTYAYVRDID